MPDSLFSYRRVMIPLIVAYATLAAQLFGCILAFLLFLYFIRDYYEWTPVDNLSNRAVFLTGCDEGLAHGAALELAKMGMPVFAGCYTKAGMEKIRILSYGLPGPLTPIPLDVTSDESVDEAARILEKLTEPYGGLYAIVNSAGVGTNIFYDDFLTTHDYRHSMEVNLYGIMRVAQRMRKLVKKVKGRIIMVTSIIGRCPVPAIGPYTVSKHAATGYAAVLRKELIKFGVQVITLEGGFFKTYLTSGARVKQDNLAVWARAPQEVKDEYGEKFLDAAIAHQVGFIDGMGRKDHTHAINVYVKSVITAYPRRKYKIGWDTIFLWHPMSVMPAWAQDSIFAFLNWATGEPMPQCIKDGK